MQKQSIKQSSVNITVFEFGLLSSNIKSVKDKRVKKVTEEAYEYLKKCCLCDESESRFLKLKIAFGMEVLQVQNYAGVILCPDGTQIEVLPKIAKHTTDSDGAEQARSSLLMMLKSLKQFRHIETGAASIRKQRMPLLEIFIEQFLNSVNRLIKKGIKSDYVCEQNNNSFLKGKLLHSCQLRHNFINRHKFYVEFDSYLTDIPVNRIIHSALAVILQYTKLSRNKKLAQELLFAFDEVPLSQDYKSDLSAIQMQRGMNHYYASIQWSRLILEGFSPQSMLGHHNAYSLLFPMEAVFESYVAKYLLKHVPFPKKLSAQVQSKSLVKYGDREYFRLKPDLYLSRLTEKNVVLDTKWKLIDKSKTAGKDKFGLSQGDFYQMLGYGFKYLSGEGNLVLIYPRTANFDTPLEHSFNYDDDNKLTLKVVPFDVSPHCSNRIDLCLIGFHDE